MDNGFKMVGHLGRATKDSSEGDSWVSAINAGRPTRRLDNIDPKTNRRVPAPDPHATSVIPARASKTTLINPATAGLEHGKTMMVGDDKSTKRF